MTALEPFLSRATVIVAKDAEHRLGRLQRALKGRSRASPPSSDNIGREHPLHGRQR